MTDLHLESWWLPFHFKYTKKKREKQVKYILASVLKIFAKLVQREEIKQAKFDG